MLNVDRNGYYGGESASLNLEQLYAKFKPGKTPPENNKEWGRLRDYYVDLCPKFLMACGERRQLNVLPLLASVHSVVF